MIETVEAFETTFNEMGGLKPPGVSGSRIKNLKEFFLSHVDEEDKLVSIILNGCKSIPVSNKLGPLYVIDAIIRALIEEIGSSVVSDESPNGTAAAAVNKLQKNIESLLDDAIPNSNDDVKERISKLIDIWVTCSTFDRKTMDSVKNKYYKSFTPPGTPPQKKAAIVITKPIPTQPAAKDPTSVLQALANLAKSTPSPKSAANANAKLASSTNNALSPPSSAPATVNDAANSSNPNAIFQLLQNMNKMTSNSSGGNNEVNNNNNNQNDYQNNDFRDRNDRGRNNDLGNNRRRDRSPDRGSKPTHVEGERNVPGSPYYRIKKAFIDNSIPQGCINVYSRTIFIGGVPPSMDEHQLIQTLKPYAEVQSVILNTSRKHAFVKVYSRNEAEQVLQAFSTSHPSGLRARWGVGFGPRDCCNYQTGISTIPIQRLTDADRKWVVSAEWGGSIPGLDLQPGLFIEEPDIEVGHGVSSKSISRKMPTNSSQNGPKSDNSNNRYNNNNSNNNNNHRNNQNPNTMPLGNNNNFNNNNFQQGPPPQGMPFQQSPPMQFQPNPYQQQQGMPNMMGGQPQFNGGMTPSSGSSQGQPPMDQAQMMAAMMAAMMNNQGGQQPGGAPNVDMNGMLQMMTSMMNQQQNQQPPQ